MFFYCAVTSAAVGISKMGVIPRGRNLAVKTMKWELFQDVEYCHEGHYTRMISNDDPQHVLFGREPAADRIASLTYQDSAVRVGPNQDLGSA